MSLHRFFLEEQRLSEESSHEFPLRLCPSDMKHARVLRLNPEEHIAVIDADMDYFECEIASFDKDQLIVRISSHVGKVDEPFSVSLFQGLPKGDKLDTVIRQVTEIGISSIHPFECSRSVVKIDTSKASKKRDRWLQIAKNAAMQSGRGVIPEVFAPVPLTDAVCLMSEYDAIVVFWEEAPQSENLSIIFEDSPVISDAHGTSVAVVIGPEGGLTKEEVDFILKSCPNARVATLGNTILRTETAALVGCSLVIYELGGLGSMKDSDE